MKNRLHKCIHLFSIFCILAMSLSTLGVVPAEAAGDNPLDTTFDGDGLVTTSFSDETDGAAAVAIQADGKIVVTGSSFHEFALARYNIDGTLDTNFDVDGKVTTDFGPYDDGAGAMAIQNDGKIVLAGYTSFDNSTNTAFALARYNTNGTLDSTFDADGKLVTNLGSGYDYVSDVAIQADGKIVVVGDKYLGINDDDVALVRYNADGSLDTSFGAGGIVIVAIGNAYDYGASIAIQTDGKIVVGGGSYNTNSKTDFALVRFNINGSLDGSFNSDGIVTLDFNNDFDRGGAVALQEDGKIIIAGYDDNGNGLLARYNNDGSLDTSFGEGGKAKYQIGDSYYEARDIALQSNGKIVTAGYTRYGYPSLNYNFELVRYNNNGTLDASFLVSTDFGANLDDLANAVAIQPDGKIIAVGSRYISGSNYDFALARYKGTEPSIRYVKPVAEGTGDCSNWINACALQTALTNALSGDEIWVAAGVYKPTTNTNDRAATFQLQNGVAIYGGFDGSESAREQRNPVTNVTILSGDIDNNDSQTPIITDPTIVIGNTTNSYHVVTGNYGSPNPILDGFTITAGNTVGNINNRPDLSGGGILNAYSNPMLINLTFIGNVAQDGAGMSNYSSNPTLNNITFANNLATDYGGGIFNGAMFPTLPASNPSLTNVTFTNNLAGYGGGIYNSSSSSPILTNVTLSGNSSVVFGGGMANTSGSDPQILNTIFWGNTAPTGAQIYNVSSTSLINDSVIQGDCPIDSNCTNVITTNPQLGMLGNYGGVTQTIPLLAGSSAIDMGNDTICPATDQRGVARPQGAHCDIGAFEVDLAPASWVITNEMYYPRDYHTATLLTDGSVLVAGGSSWLSGDRAERYYPSLGSWSTTGIMTKSREAHTATLLPDGKVLLAGGWNSKDKVFANAELYNPDLNQWTETGGLAVPRYLHTATLLQDGRVLVAGGVNNTGYLASAEIYDPATRRWTATGDLQHARYKHTATLLQDGRVLVAGGQDGSGAIAAAELYDPATGIWTVADALNTGRYSHTATLLLDGKVLVTGGWDTNEATLSSAEIYDPGTELWTPTENMIVARESHTATLLQNGRVLIAGGRLYTTTGLNSSEVYDPDSGTWTVDSGLLNYSRYLHTATLLPDGKVLAVGGFSGYYFLSSAELYNPVEYLTISGNAGVAGASLSYKVGTVKTVTVDDNGYYSFTVPSGWSGAVTPSKPGYVFNPPSRAYTNVITDQSGQDYNPCLTINVAIGGTSQGSYCLSSGLSTRQSYNANNGPVKVTSLGGAPILAAQRILYTGYGTQPTSFVEMMGLPDSQVDTTYWFPWYKNVGDGIDTQLRIGNVSASDATVHIFVAGVEVTGSPFTLTTSGAGQSQRLNFALNNGPVKVVSDVNIVATERLIYFASDGPTSFSEMVGLPNSQLSTTYWFPWYKNAGEVDTQIRIGNVSASDATVHIFIAGVEVTGSPFTLTTTGAGQSQRLSFPINDGPVQIVSDVNIVASQRILYYAGGVPTSFVETMGIPDGQLSTAQWFPWYKNDGIVDTQLRIGNVSGTDASVHVYIGGVEVTGSPFTLTASGAGQSQRLSFAGVNDGPVKIVSDQNVVASERLIYILSGVPVSFSEMMGMPDNALSPTYLLPWYKNVGEIDTQLRFGVP